MSELAAREAPVLLDGQRLGRASRGARPRYLGAKPMMTLDVGRGAPVLLLHGFGLSPRLYRRSAEELAARGQVRVIVPSLYDVTGPWTPESALGHLVATLDQLGLDRVTCIGHSFGGCFQLGLAATRVERVVELVFCDTLAWSRRWDLARQALHPVNLLLLATAGAAVDFAHTSLTHPTELAQAAWHGFVGDHRPLVAAVARSGIPSHVLWAQRDTLLRQDEGRAFASELGASFDVISPHRGGKTVDHNWMYRCPQLFADRVERLGLEAWRQGRSAGTQ
jgi:pimeloyl-ACP methyl ester carboxylesterase